MCDHVAFITTMPQHWAYRHSFFLASLTGEFISTSSPESPISLSSFISSVSLTSVSFFSSLLRSLCFHLDDCFVCLWFGSLTVIYGIFRWIFWGRGRTNSVATLTLGHRVKLALPAYNLGGGGSSVCPTELVTFLSIALVKVNSCGYLMDGWVAISLLHWT